jgi:hypothetical protein
MYERRKNPCAEFCLVEGWLWHIYHVFKHKPTAVPLENELTLPTRGARFTLFFVAVYGIDLDQLSILNSQAHMATQAVIDVTTF